MPSQIDVDSMIQGGWDVSIKAPEDPKEADHRRMKDLILLVVCIIFLLGGAGLSIWFIVDPRFMLEEKGWGRATLTTIMSGVVGYTVGKQRDRNT